MMEEKLSPAAAVRRLSEIFTAKEIADQCGVKPRAVYKWQQDQSTGAYSTTGIIKLRKLYATHFGGSRAT